MGTSEEADKLIYFGALSRSLDELKQKHSDAQKIQTTFYPEPSPEEIKRSDYTPKAIPIQLYLYREGMTWYLLDLTTPIEPKTNEEPADNVSGKAPLEKLFTQLNTKLRFPRV